MLKSRIIPCLLMSEGNLVKTQKFQNPKYIGDPLNAVRILLKACVSLSTSALK